MVFSLSQFFGHIFWRIQKGRDINRDSKHFVSKRLFWEILIWKKRAGVELGLNQADTVSLELGLKKKLEQAEFVLGSTLTLSMAGGQFDTKFSDISRTFKRVHVQFGEHKKMTFVSKKLSDLQQFL